MENNRRRAYVKPEEPVTNEASNKRANTGVVEREVPSNDNIDSSEQKAPEERLVKFKFNKNVKFGQDVLKVDDVKEMSISEAEMLEQAKHGTILSR